MGGRKRECLVLYRTDDDRYGRQMSATVGASPSLHPKYCTVIPETDDSMFQQQVTFPFSSADSSFHLQYTFIQTGIQANFPSGFPTSSACPHSHQRAPQLQQHCAMTLHEPQFRLALYSISGSRSTSGGCHLGGVTRQAEKPRKLARPAGILLSILVHLDPRLADDGRRFSSELC